MRIHKVPLSAQVVVLALTTAPASIALAGPAPADRAAREAPVAAAEEVNVRIQGKRLHATVRAERGRHVAVVTSTDGKHFAPLANARAVGGADGQAHLEVDLDAYEAGEATVAIVTAADAELTRDVRATDGVKVVLRGGALFEAGSPTAGPAREVPGVSIKGLKGVQGAGVELAARSLKAIRGVEQRAK